MIKAAKARSHTNVTLKKICFRYELVEKQASIYFKKSEYIF